MRRSVQIAVAITTLLGVSTLATAQRGGGGSGGMGGGRRAQFPQDMGRTGPPPLPPTLAAIVLDHDGDLSLADSQKTTIDSLKVAQDNASKPLLARLDSLRPTRMPAGGMNDLSQEQRDEMQQRAVAVQLVMADVREMNDGWRLKVMGLLNESQQKKATELEEEAQKKAQDEGRRRAQDFGRARGGGGRPPQD